MKPWIEKCVIDFLKFAKCCGILLKMFVVILLLENIIFKWLYVMYFNWMCNEIVFIQFLRFSETASGLSKVVRLKSVFGLVFWSLCNSRFIDVINETIKQKK